MANYVIGGGGVYDIHCKCGLRCPATDITMK